MATSADKSLGAVACDVDLPAVVVSARLFFGAVIFLALLITIFGGATVGLAAVAVAQTRSAPSCGMITTSAGKDVGGALHPPHLGRDSCHCRRLTPL